MVAWGGCEGGFVNRGSFGDKGGLLDRCIDRYPLGREMLRCRSSSQAFPGLTISAFRGISINT